MRLFALAAKDVTNEAIWGDVLPHFERFVRECGECSPEHVRTGAARGTLQVWGVQDAERVQVVCVTEISETARHRVCVIRIACGNACVSMQERLLDEIGKWARDEARCDRVRLYGRRGWLKRFPRFHQIGVIGEWNLRPN